MQRWAPFATPAARDRFIVWAVLLLTGADYMIRHQMHGNHPKTLRMTGWWLWDDQGYYIRAARAWVAGNLDPAQHWYPPGYALLGAAFVWLMPIQPFYLPDLLCLIAYGWLLVGLAERLAPDLRHTRIIGAMVFFITVALSRLQMQSYVEPWTSTPTAPLTLACLHLALRFWDRPSAGGAAWLGGVATSLVLFRPTDAAILTAVTAPFAGLATLRAEPGWRMLRIAVAGIAAAALPVLVLAVIQVAIHGWSTAGYIEQSSRLGFEWRLLPLNWVTLFVSPEPLIPNERSMTQLFPWIMPGIAGMAACLVAARGTARIRHALVIGAVTVHCATYLAYRDLHPQGLVHFGNYHYFKWTIPIFGLYAAYLVVLVKDGVRPGIAWAIGLAVMASLFAWRAEWMTPAPGYSAEARIEPPRTLILPEGIHAVQDGVRLMASGSFESIFIAPYSMQAGGHTYVSNADLKSLPMKGGLMFTTLRPITARLAIVTFNPGVTPDPTVPPQIGRQVIRFGWPALLDPLRRWWPG